METVRTLEEIKNDIIRVLEENDNAFIEAVDELDSYCGFADGYRVFDMCELDELFCDCKVTEFLNKLAPNFDLRCDYFADTIYGLESVTGKAEYYRENTDAGEVAENLLDNRYCINISESDLDELLDEYEEAEEADE